MASPVSRGFHHLLLRVVPAAATSIKEKACPTISTARQRSRTAGSTCATYMCFRNRRAHRRSSLPSTRNVTAIALQVPDVAFGGVDVAVWARISLSGHAPQHQVSRAAHPLLRSFFFPQPGADTEALNAGSPAGDVAAYTDVVRRTAAHVAELSRAADPGEHAAALVAAFLPDQLRYRPGQRLRTCWGCASTPPSRRPADVGLQS
jgi:hypothetical protein